MAVPDTRRLDRALLHVQKCVHGPGGEAEEAACSQGDMAEALPAAAEAPCLNQNPFGFPLSLVNRIMCMDPDVTRISGAKLISAALHEPQWM